jgi:hypothetical protein
LASRSTPYRRSISASDARAGPIARPFAHADRSEYSTSSSAIRWWNSARIADRRFAKPKKSSARRKKPRPVWRLHVSLSAFPSRRWASSVASVARSADPTAGSPAAEAIPSNSVDLPEPFSPTKKVTAVGKASADNSRMTGTENGNAPSSPEPLRLTERRKGPFSPCVSSPFGVFFIEAVRRGIP